MLKECKVTKFQTDYIPISQVMNCKYDMQYWKNHKTPFHRYSHIFVSLKLYSEKPQTVTNSFTVDKDSMN